MSRSSSRRRTGLPRPSALSRARKASSRRADQRHEELKAAVNIRFHSTRWLPNYLAMLQLIHATRGDPSLFCAARLVPDMGRGRNKYQSRENRAQLRDILMRDWDPIGISGVPGAADEYDTYADRAYVMLMEGRATAEEISAYLFEVATKHMGITDDDSLAERSAQVARKLIKLRPGFDTHSFHRIACGPGSSNLSRRE
jgi:hypothetical protein